MMGLDVLSVAIHMGNLLLLFVLLRIFLYKPVRKFMDARLAKQKAAEDKAQQDLQDAETMKAHYETLLREYEQDNLARVKESVDQARSEGDAIVASARDEAHRIVPKAEEEAEHERRQMLTDMREDIADMAMEMAATVLQREVSEADNQRIIDEFIGKVEGSDGHSR